MMLEGRVGKFFDKKFKIINSTVPSRIYPENVRAFFGINRLAARAICNMAVADGVFTRKVGLECPNDGRIVVSYSEGENIAETVVCDICESRGEDVFEFKSQDMPHIEFYQLVE